MKILMSMLRNNGGSEHAMGRSIKGSKRLQNGKKKLAGYANGTELGWK